MTIKDDRLELRISKEMKEQFRLYAQEHGMTMSECVMDLCHKVFKGDTDKTEN